jgi:hypothetical protein
VSAYVRAPILYQGDEQAIFVQVHAPQDQRPVEGIQVELSLSYGDQTLDVSLPLTDAQGQSQGRLETPGAAPGQQVQVQVMALIPGGAAIGSAGLAYRVWW